MMDDYMLTTNDNPFNPFEQFTSWLMFDMEQGYNTCGYLARIVVLEDDMSEKEINDAIDVAIETIIANDPLNMYIRVPNPSAIHN